MYCTFLIMASTPAMPSPEHPTLKYSSLGMVSSCLMLVLIVCTKAHVIIKEVKIKRKEGFQTFLDVMIIRELHIN